MSETKHLRWSYLSTFSTASMQLVAAATITRFLQPADFGLAALAMLCYNMTGYFTQLGVGRAIVQKATLTIGNIRAAFTLAIAAGVGGFLILAAISPLLARYFRDSRLAPIIVFFGLNLVFQSASLVTGGLLRREFHIREMAICDFLGYLLSTFGIGLPMAIHGYGVWALVGSNVSQPLIVAIAYFIARPHSVVPSFRREDYAHIAGFSGKASLTTAIEAIGSSLDMTIMGRLVTPAAIGLYGRSLTLSTQPCYQLSMGLTRVFIPSLARTAERSRQAAAGMLIASERQLMSLIFPMCASAAIAAPTIIPVIFGRQWIPAIPVYQVLCLVASLDSSFDLPAVQLEIANEFRHKVGLQTSFAAALGVSIFFFAPRGGVLAVAIAYAVLQAVRSLIFHYLSARSLQVSLLSLLASWVPGLVCAAAVAAVLGVAQRYVPASGPVALWLKLGGLVLVALSVVSFVYYRFYRDEVYVGWHSLFSADADGGLAEAEQ